MDKIIPAHPASFTNDYNLLLENAQMKLREEAIDNFIDSKIGETYIVIDPLFKDCAFSREAWSSKIRKTE